MKSVVAGVLVLTMLVIAAFAVQPEGDGGKQAQPAVSGHEHAGGHGDDDSKSDSKEEEKFVYFKMTTSKGDLYLELNNEAAPISTANFQGYVESEYYNGTIFHRVIEGFMIQGGGFEADMSRKETKSPIENEWTNGLKNVRGSIAMARTSAPDSATSQFFINVVDNPFLDTPRGGAAYAVFGRVVKGMDVVDKIRVVTTGTRAGMGDVPIEPIVIEKVVELDDEQVEALELVEAED